MSLTFNITNFVALSQNVTFDADVAATGALATTNVDFIAKAYFSNLLSGNYVQNSLDINDISSNVSVCVGGLLSAAFAYVNKSNSSGFNASGYTPTTTDLYTGTAVQIEGGANVSISAPNKVFVNRANYSATTHWVSGSEGATLKAGRAYGGLGAVLLEAASAALFKKFGKHAAISNDYTFLSSAANTLATSLGTTFNAQIVETNSDYANSAAFRAYLYSGKYKDATEPANGAATTYNFNSSIIRVIVQMTGSAVDPDGLNTLNDEYINIFGNSSNGDTKVTTAGTYAINILFELEHRN